MLRKLILAAGAALTLLPHAYAAGIDSRTYTCAGLQSLITTKGFVFISQVTFGDFVVANSSYCEGTGVGMLELRSVATSDHRECLVNYCVDRDRDLGVH